MAPGRARGLRRSAAVPAGRQAGSRQVDRVLPPTALLLAPPLVADVKGAAWGNALLAGAGRDPFELLQRGVACAAKLR